MNTLERLKELQATATPGPWDRDGLYNVLRIAKKSLDWELVNPTEDASMPDEDDAEFIVALHEALPALLELAEADIQLNDLIERNDKFLGAVKHLRLEISKKWAERDAALAKLEKEG
jgi:hypothetical protein